MSLVEAALKVGGGVGFPEISPFFLGRDHGFGEKNGEDKKGAAKQVGVLFVLFFFNGKCILGREVKKKTS